MSGRARVHKQPSLADAVMAFLSGDATANDVARAFLVDSRVRAMVKSAAMQKSVASMESDVTQDCLVVFHERYVAIPGALKLPSAESVYSLVFAIADGVTMTKRRELEQNRFGFVSLDDTLGEDGEYEEQNYHMLEVDDSFEDDRLRELDMERAGREMERRLKAESSSPMMRMITNILAANGGAVEEPAERRMPAERSEVGTDERLTDEQRRLKEIRQEIGLTLKGYAVALGINLASLSAYIYGRTDSVPQDVMETAEHLWREHKQRFDEQRVVYEGKPMEEILDSWCAMLGITREQDERWVNAIAGITRVQPVTVRRWVQVKYRPTIRKLIEYGLAISQHVDDQARQQRREDAAPKGILNVA